MTEPLVSPAHQVAVAVILTVPPHAYEPRPHHDHYEIEWRGPVGAFRSNTWYRSAEAAWAMARECGARELVDEVVARR